MPSHTEKEKKKIRASILSRIKKFLARESAFSRILREDRERIDRRKKQKAERVSRSQRRAGKKQGRGK